MQRAIVLPLPRPEKKCGRRWRARNCWVLLCIGVKTLGARAYHTHAPKKGRGSSQRVSPEGRPQTILPCTEPNTRRLGEGTREMGLRGYKRSPGYKHTPIGTPFEGLPRWKNPQGGAGGPCVRGRRDRRPGGDPGPTWSPWGYPSSQGGANLSPGGAGEKRKKGEMGGGKCRRKQEPRKRTPPHPPPRAHGPWGRGPGRPGGMTVCRTGTTTLTVPWTWSWVHSAGDFLNDPHAPPPPPPPSLRENPAASEAAAGLNPECGLQQDPAHGPRDDLRLQRHLPPVRLERATGGRRVDRMTGKGFRHADGDGDHARPHATPPPQSPTPRGAGPPDCLNGRGGVADPYLPTRGGGRG